VSRSNADQETCTHTERLLVTCRKAVIVGRFQEPADAVFASGPEHEVSCQLTRNRIGRFPILLEKTHSGPMPSMNSVLRDMVHGFLKRRSVSHSVEFRV
jgi:hypothetical protein